MFERLVWDDRSMTLDGLVFRLDHYKDASPLPDDEAFGLLKLKGLVDEYEAFFKSRPIQPENVLELGMWDGGSLAFWYQCLKPRKLVGLDLKDRTDSPYFRKFVAERGLSERIKTHWRTNQADPRALRAIVHEEYDGELDLVFDDASHLYGPTKASFEILFPLIRPGGFYIIEDWAWMHWASFTPKPESVRTGGPTRLVFELTELLGSTRDVIGTLTAYKNFVAVERGPAELSDHFSIEEHIFRRKWSVVRALEERIGRSPEVGLRRLARRVRRVLRKPQQ